MINYLKILMITLKKNKQKKNKKKNSYLHDYNTRTGYKIHLDYQRINYGKFSIKYSGLNYGILFQKT